MYLERENVYLYPARTPYGEAWHVVAENKADRTLCGRFANVVYEDDRLLTPDGIQHPWRCTVCSRAVQRRAAQQS